MKVRFNTKTAVSTGLLLALSSTVSAGAAALTKATQAEVDTCVAAVTAITIGQRSKTRVTDVQ